MSSLDIGYLQSPYLGADSGYLTNITQDSQATQFRVVNTPAPKIVGAQFKVINTKLQSVGAQFRNTATTRSLYGSQFRVINSTFVARGAQFTVVNTKVAYSGAQFRVLNTPPPKLVGAQFNVLVVGLAQPGAQFRVVDTQPTYRGAQYRVTNPNGLQRLGEQYSAVTSKQKLVGAQFKITPVPTPGLAGANFNKAAHYWRGVPSYLTGPYLTENYYLGVTHDNIINGQFQVINSNPKYLGAQFRVINTKTTRGGEQFKVINTKLNRYGAQVTVNQGVTIGAQVRVSLYNTTNLRILTTFPSRGTSALGGNNWTATSTAAGDFSTRNLNTDIVEQYWRSAAGVVTGVQLVCDTGLAQGAFVDTVAMLNHNLSGGASVLVEGSSVSNFATTGISFNIKREAMNAYYIAPTLPLVGFRYWRFTINDVGNPDGFIRIGSLVFGSAVILAGECFTDTVRLSRKQYVDGVFTEGFTNVKNDRGQKKTIALDFKSLNFNRSNYKNLRTITEDFGTILKCLWIPTPQYPSRFAVFGKLVDLPSETHNDRGETHDYVDVSFTVDEAE